MLKGPYEYGNDNLSPQEGFVRLVVSFTDDLDLVSEKLFGLKTRGGQEYCGQVIRDATHQLTWSKSAASTRRSSSLATRPSTWAPSTSKVLQRRDRESDHRQHHLLRDGRRGIDRLARRPCWLTAAI